MAFDGVSGVFAVAIGSYRHSVSSGEGSLPPKAARKPQRSSTNKRPTIAISVATKIFTTIASALATAIASVTTVTLLLRFTSRPRAPTTSACWTWVGSSLGSTCLPPS